MGAIFALSFHENLDRQSGGKAETEFLAGQLDALGNNVQLFADLAENFFARANTCRNTPMRNWQRS
jgi:hypothetical protein